MFSKKWGTFSKHFTNGIGALGGTYYRAAPYTYDALYKGLYPAVLCGGKFARSLV